MPIMIDDCRATVGKGTEGEYLSFFVEATRYHSFGFPCYFDDTIVAACCSRSEIGRAHV